jgi:hypothetical protein
MNSAQNGVSSRKGKLRAALSECGVCDYYVKKILNSAWKGTTIKKLNL